jgi:AcrR family transcriptional regulator
VYETVSYSGRPRAIVASAERNGFVLPEKREGKDVVADTEIRTRAADRPEARTPRRGPERREAICDAVFELLGEVGYDRMTMDAVATRARASKATIYRTWPDKPGLVAEALINRLGPTPKAPDTGSLRGDLMTLMSLTVGLANSPDGEVITGVITAASRNPTLARALHECTYASKRILNETIIRQAAARGEVRPDTDPDLFNEVTYAMIISRRLAAQQPLDEEWASHVVDDILIPLLTFRRCAEGDSGAE